MIVIGKRAYGTDQFRWFYHPLLPENEKETLTNLKTG